MRILFFFLYVAVVSFGYGLKYLNLKHLKAHGAEVPPEFEGRIDQELLRKTRDYTVETSRFGFFESAMGHLMILLFLFGGLLSLYNRWILDLSNSFILSGVLFFLFLVYTMILLSIPFDLYATFHIEEKYGFNTQSPWLWIADQVKSLVLSTILLGILGGVAFWLVKSSPGEWWLWLWGFLFLFGIFMMYLSPYLIEPLFNQYTPLNDPELEERIRGLMDAAGIRISRIFKMDASRRSRHTNAYFTGIGNVKRIVLFDTLLEKLDPSEVVAVLAHEAGHWKKKHLFKGIVFSQAMMFAGIYLAWRLTRTDLLTDFFGVAPSSFFAKLVILGFLYSIISFPLTPFFSFLTRHYEREADEFACRMTGDPEGLATALVKLARDNLSNLHPHPWYAAFYDSHPPVVERIRRIRGLRESLPSVGQ